MSKKKIAVLTGAGISAESGVKTFRDAGGLWEGHDVTEVASIQSWMRGKENKAMMLDFYNQRRRQLLEVQPNEGHRALVDLEEKFEVHIITQNVDDLHERAGSSNIIHLHGELLKVRSTADPSLILDWKKDLNMGDRCEKGSQLRPHIVWFGEMVPMLEVAAKVVAEVDYVIVIGTSMQVYPAASLVGYAPPLTPIYYIDPHPTPNYEMERAGNLIIVEKVATIGVRRVVNELLEKN